jgi:hypothetical protein
VSPGDKTKFLQEIIMIQATNLIEQISSKPERPTEFALLRKFNRTQIANRLGVSTGYLCNILSGTKQAGKQTFIRIQELIEQIDSELQVDGGNSHA